MQAQERADHISLNLGTKYLHIVAENPGGDADDARDS
jgi:hypothetical protein